MYTGILDLYAEYIIWNARLDEAQARIKIAGRNIGNLRYADDTILMAESQEELKSLWWRWKRRVKKLAYNSTFRKWRSWHMVPSFTANRWGNNGNSDRLFISLGSKITAGGDYSHEIKRHLLHGRKAMTNLHSVLKSRDITLPTKVCIVKAMIFPVVMYGCESWTLKTEYWRIDAFNLWCWRRLLRVPWKASRSN